MSSGTIPIRAEDIILDPKEMEEAEEEVEADEWSR